MSTWPVAVLLKSVCLFLFFLGIRALSRFIERNMSEGKLKSLLFRRIS